MINEGLIELLRNKTALGRLGHGEVMDALTFIESLGYDLSEPKKPQPEAAEPLIDG